MLNRVAPSLAVLLALALPAGALAAGPNTTTLLSAPDGSGAVSDDPTQGSLPLDRGTQSLQAQDPSRYLILSDYDQGGTVSPRGTHLFLHSPAGTALVDRGNGTSSPAASDPPLSAAISSDGRWAAFTSRAQNLTGVSSGSIVHVFLRDLQANTIRLVDVGVDTFAGDGNADDRVSVAVGADGHVLVAFASSATNLLVDPPTAGRSVYLRDVDPADPDLRSGSTELVSVRGTQAAAQAGQQSTSPVLSADGRFVAFRSTQTNLVTGETPASANVDDVYRRQVRDCTGTICAATGTTIKVSRAAAADGDGSSGDPTLSADGGTVAFGTYARNLATDATAPTASYQLVVARQPGTPSVSFSYASRAPGSTVTADTSVAGGIDAAGRRAVFQTPAANLSPDHSGSDSSGAVYVKDLDTGVLRLVSRATGAAGAPARNLPSFGLAALSPDGSNVLFSTMDDALSDQDDDDFQQVFARKVDTSVTTLASGNPGGPTGHGDSDTSFRSISADGRYVVFTSDMDRLVAGSASRDTQVFVRDQATGAVRLVSRADGPDGAVGTGRADGGSVSDDGRYVAFLSTSENLPGSHDPGRDDVYVRDLVAGRTIAVSRPGPQSPGQVRYAEISGDGRHVVFDSDTSATPNDDNSRIRHVYLANLDDGSLTLVDRAGGAAGTVANDGQGNSAGSPRESVSTDGSRVAFTSQATNLGVAGPSQITQIWVRDLRAQATTLVSRSGASGDPGDRGSSSVSISGDGSVVAFASAARNLGTQRGSRFNTPTLYVRDLAAASLGSPAGLDGDVEAAGPQLDRTGRRLSFTTDADLDPADTDGADDLYLLDRPSGARTLLSRGAVAVGDLSAAGPLSASGSCAAFASFSNGVLAEQAGTPPASRIYARAIDAACPPAAQGPPPTDTGTTTTTTPPPPPPPALADTVAPRLSQLKLTRSRFRVGRANTATIARVSAGTIIRFQLSEPAKTIITFSRSRPGRKAGKRCVAPSRRTRKAKACARLTAVGTLTRASRRGANLVAFTGRIGKKALKPGAYAVTLVATDPAGNRSVAAAARFAVVRR